jgi:hypothetical protein
MARQRLLRRVQLFRHVDDGFEADEGEHGEVGRADQADKGGGIGRRQHLR